MEGASLWNDCGQEACRNPLQLMPKWLKEVAPSSELREWFHRDPKCWNEFRRRYFAELRHHMEALSPILEAAHKGTVTLLYTYPDREHNNAVALREFLEHSLNPKEPASCLCLQ